MGTLPTRASSELPCFARPLPRGVCAADVTEPTKAADSCFAAAGIYAAFVVGTSICILRNNRKNRDMLHREEGSGSEMSGLSKESMLQGTRGGGYGRCARVGWGTGGIAMCSAPPHAQGFLAHSASALRCFSCCHWPLQQCAAHASRDASNKPQPMKNNTASSAARPWAHIFMN